MERACNIENKIDENFFSEETLVVGNKKPSLMGEGFSR